MVARRTQAERRASARERLERAAIDALVQVGASGASTTEICRRAELSQGALFQHYPSKQALLVAAVGRLYDELRAEVLARYAAVPPGPGRVRAVLALTWEAFSDPRSVATLELYHQARTDRELHALLSPMLDAHAQALLAEAARLLGPDVRPTADLPAILAVTMAAVQGAAPGAVIEGRPPALLPAALDWLAHQLTGGHP